MGFAIEDFSTLRYLHDVIAREGGAVEVDLVPALADPTDLFSLLAAAP